MGLFFMAFSRLDILTLSIVSRPIHWHKHRRIKIILNSTVSISKEHSTNVCVHSKMIGSGWNTIFPAILLAYKTCHAFFRSCSVESVLTTSLSVLQLYISVSISRIGSFMQQKTCLLPLDEDSLSCLFLTSTAFALKWGGTYICNGALFFGRDCPLIFFCRLKAFCSLSYSSRSTWFFIMFCMKPCSISSLGLSRAPAIAAFSQPSFRLSSIVTFVLIRTFSAYNE